MDMLMDRKATTIIPKTARACIFSGVLFILFFTSGCLSYGKAGRYRIAPENQSDTHPKKDMIYSPEFLEIDRPLDVSGRIVLKKMEFFQAMGQRYFFPFLIRNTSDWYGIIFEVENQSSENIQITITRLKLTDQKKWSLDLLEPEHVVSARLAPGSRQEIFPYDRNFDLGVQQHSGRSYPPSARLQAFEEQVRVPGNKKKIFMKLEYTLERAGGKPDAYSQDFTLQKESYRGFWN